MNQLEQVQRDLEAENEQLKWMLRRAHAIAFDDLNWHASARLERLENLFDHNDEIVALFAPEEDQD